jgi:enhancing lycopene biosynthesis protein 2
MAKRVAVILSGCGAGDGSEIREAVLTLLSLDRGGAEAICVAPDVSQPRVFDHLHGHVVEGPPRQAMVEAARIARGKIRPLASLQIEEVDALIFPGGEGVGSVLSNYDSRAEVCDVHPDVVRLLKGALATHRPMGFICLAPILAARVLGPVAGVRVTLGPRGTNAAKHAAVMGADVRPATARDVFIDQKNRVVSTPAYMFEDIRIGEAAAAIDKLTRAVLQLTRGTVDLRPEPDRRPEQARRPEQPPRPDQPRRPEPGRGSDKGRPDKGRPDQGRRPDRGRPDEGRRPDQPRPPSGARPPEARPGDPTRRRPPPAGVNPGRGSA